MCTERDIRNFCANVRNIRKREGLTQKEMASVLGIGVKSLQKIEKGILPPRLGIEFVWNMWMSFRIRPSSLFHSVEE